MIDARNVLELVIRGVIEIGPLAEVLITSSHGMGHNSAGIQCPAQPYPSGLLIYLDARGIVGKRDGKGKIFQLDGIEGDGNIRYPCIAGHRKMSCLQHALCMRGRWSHIRDKNIV